MLFVRIIKRWVLEDRCKGSSKEFYSGCMLVCKTRPAPPADDARCLPSTATGMRCILRSQS